MSIVPCVLSGCKHHAKPTAKTNAGVKKSKDDDTPVTSVAVGAGHTTVDESSVPGSPPSFSLRWTQGQFDPTNGSIDRGRLTEPTGEIFQKGKPSATYRSDTGDATRENKRLNMRGHVVLRSIDGKQTMRSPLGQYHGDIPIVRAMGGVTATGTFGTLSGVPELWATPDLHLIGTPDMIAKTLKLPALVALAATAALGTTRIKQGNQYELLNKGLSKLENQPNGAWKITIKPLPGQPVIVNLPSRGLVFRFSGVVVVLTDAAHTQVVHMTSEGAVNVVQTAPAGTTTMDGNGSVYDAKPNAPTADFAVGGRVTIVSLAKGKDGTITTTISKGDHGDAVLRAKPTGDESGLKSATLTGNVVVDSKGKEADGTFHGTGDRSVYTPGADVNDVDMAGHVVLTRVSKAKDGTTNTVVSRGEKGHATLDATPTAGVSPMKDAVLTGGLVVIDVDGSNGQKFKATGDKVVYTGEGAGGTAVMTGDLKFLGDVATAYGNDVGADTATVTIGKAGWETVETSNSEGKPTKTVIDPKPQPPKAPTTPVKKGRGKKGGAS